MGETEVNSGKKIKATKLIGCENLDDIRKYFVIMGDLTTEPKNIEKIDLSHSKKY